MKKFKRNATSYYRPPGPRRATVCAQVDRPDDVWAAQLWLESHRASLTFVSDDEGCGCCIHSWRIEGPAEVVQTLPPEISATTPQWNSR
jgi:hypothetical protein